MDLDPDMRQAAIEAAAKAEYEYRERLNAALPPRSGIKVWPPATLALRTVYRDEAERAFDAIAPLVARATADAIADEIEAELAAGFDLVVQASLDMAANIARAHGRMPETTG